MMLRSENTESELVFNCTNDQSKRVNEVNWGFELLNWKEKAQRALSFVIWGNDLPTKFPETNQTKEISSPRQSSLLD